MYAPCFDIFMHLFCNLRNQKLLSYLIRVQIIFRFKKIIQVNTRCMFIKLEADTEQKTLDLQCDSEQLP